MRKRKALVVTAADDWSALFAGELIGKGCDVHTASEAAEAVDLLRKHQYDLMVVDQDVGGMDVVEFVLTVRDIASGEPVLLVSDVPTANKQKVWDRCGVFVAGTRAVVAKRLGEAIAAVPAHEDAAYGG